MDGEKHLRLGLPTPFPKGRARILLADDQTAMLEVFSKLLEPQFEIVGTVTDGHSLLEAASRIRPDVVLLDLSMPLMNGTEAGERLKKLLPNTKIIVLTMSEDADVAADFLHNWAAGFLLKKSAGRELPKAIREVMRGKTYVTSRMSAKVLEAYVRSGPSSRHRALTPRQREVLKVLAEGHTMKEAANILHVTPRTVAFHKYRMMEDQGLKTNSDLLRLAIRERLVPLA
jgi:DNA-binding NarL/FixJ family response regulator